MVAPYMGAWIETYISELLSCRILVAPYMGAWIETVVPYKVHEQVESHPTWVRGLKHKREILLPNSSVAPYMGAWIETCNSL